jgi:uncharacterized protein (TIGR03000 family)
MYSLIVATMLTAGGEAPNWGGGGFIGVATSTEWSVGWGGRWGCWGCWGGGCWGYGGWRGWQTGCWGCYGCYGCCGGCYGGWYPAYGCWGCCGGCYGCYGCYGGYYPYYGGVVAAPSTVPNGASVVNKDGTPVTLTDSPAKVTVRLPADAKLYIDGQLCPLTSDVRSFNTPALAAGKKFHYTLEVVRTGGKRDSRNVVLESGKTSEVDFNKTEVVEAKK